MTSEAHVHQCPYCDLRFELHNEVKDHVVRDHPSHASAYLNVETVELPLS
jgi:hypothetical protein